MSKRILCLFLSLLVLLGSIPLAFASEVPKVVASFSVPEETENSETEAVEESTAFDKFSETESSPLAETTAEIEDEKDSPAEDEYDTMPAANTTGSVTLFDLASPNYTTYLSSQISVTYKPNGTGSTTTAYLKNLGWHYARYGGVAYSDDPIYCIEPNKNYAASTSGNYMDTDVNMTGSGGTRGSDVWYAMPEYYREFIGLVLLYSDQMWDNSCSVTNTAMANNPNVPLRIATQFLIYEIVTGMREQGTFARKSSNGYTSGDVFYNAGTKNVTGFASDYNALVSSVQAALKIPSFTSSSSSNAPTINLTASGTTVTDTNGVLPHFSISNGNGASFSKSGNNLTITQTGPISPSTVFQLTRYMPSAKSATYAVYYGGVSTYQTCIKLYNPGSSNLTGYFKLNVPDPTGNVSLVKTTEDGKNLAGWRFEIYSDSACTKLLSGPHTTDENGRFSVSDLNAGTVYVKEIGHTDPTIDALYQCEGDNPQKVIITGSQTASVKFYNRLSLGDAKIIKKTNTGKNLEGWKFNVYTNKECTALVSGSPFTTGADGSIVMKLQPGTYYVREVDQSGEKPEWDFDLAVKSVTVMAGSTASVTFTNTHFGYAKIVKTTNTEGDLAGWKFNIYTDAACSNLVEGSPFVSGENGTISARLLPSTYYVKEVEETDKFPDWEFDTEVKTVKVAAGETASVTFNNVMHCKVKIIKKTNTGLNLAGWKFNIYTDAECTSLVEGAPFVSGEDGTIVVGLKPGKYFVQEVADEETYPDWVFDTKVYEFDLKNGEMAEITIENHHMGQLKLIKSMPDGGSLAGWVFDVYRKSDNTHMGTFTTDETGVILTGYWQPGEYVVEEKLTDPAYECKGENPKTVTLEAGKTAEVIFVNRMRPGEIEILKVDLEGNPLAGAEFLLEWSAEGTLWWPVELNDTEQIVAGKCSSVGLENGRLVSGEDGVITFTGLHPGVQYRLTETAAPEGYQLLTEPAFTGTLPAVEDFCLILMVHNAREFVLPKTGSNSMMQLPLAMMLCGGFFIALVIQGSHKRKEQ